MLKFVSKVKVVVLSGDHGCVLGMFARCVYALLTDYVLVSADPKMASLASGVRDLMTWYWMLNKLHSVCAVTEREQLTTTLDSLTQFMKLVVCPIGIEIVCGYVTYMNGGKIIFRLV